MGAVLNMRPDLFAGAVAHVPFVDVMNTMSDPSIPLTTEEWREWGNPNERVYYDYIKTYSPYDNVRAQKYPNMLVTAGLYDNRVGYWEPAKWVAKLRKHNTANTTVLLKVDMDSGHSGASDRYRYYKEAAKEISFTLSCVGLGGIAQ
eukprot:UN0837